LTEQNNLLTKELEKYKNPKKDSTNSSIPPSQDPHRKPYPKREKSGKKSGGQKGHKGETRMLSDTPDEIRELHPMECQHCGGVDFIPENKVRERRQIVDIPPIKPIITEYQQKAGICVRCGKKNFGEFPENLKLAVQIGNRTTATIGYLHIEHHQSYERTARILNDLFGLSISEGTIKTKLNHLQNILEPKYEDILKNLKSSSVIGSDETRLSVNGENGYTWIFQNHLYSYFKSEFSRAFKIIEEVIGGIFEGFWVSDRYGAQLKVVSKHQLCLAHLIRDCKFAIGSESSQWGEKLKSLFKEAIKFRKKRGKEFSPQRSEDFREVQKFKQQLQEIFQKPPPLEEEKKLFKGLVGRQDQLLRFLENSEVPYDNNGSERGLRNCVIHRKVTGGFRTKEGAYCYDVIASFIETTKKHSKNILDELIYCLRKNQYLLST
jgi:transposase